MTTKTKKKETQPNKSGAEKPVSLWGASFQDILKALLKTKPIQNDVKEQKTKKKTSQK